MKDLIGKRLGEFEIVHELGRGGMGIVYEALQMSLNRRVALKVLGPGLGLTPRAIDRFRREAAAAAKLHHTNIVPVYATGEESGFHFYAMELIPGSGLDAVIRDLASGGCQPPVSATPQQGADTPRSPEAHVLTGLHVDSPAPATPATSSHLSTGSSYFDTVARLIADVADALQHAHSHNIIHRDIKPSNLLLSPEGRLSVTDFGLARVLEEPGMTQTGEFMGTPAYMAPEQIAGGRIPIDHRCDIYSLGATLYELLALQPPFTADRRDQLLAMVMQKEPTSPRSINPHVPRDLETICLKCLEKDPDRRYRTAKELAEDLRRFVNRFAILAKRTGPLGKLRKWVKRNPAVAASGVVVLLVLGGAGAFAWQVHHAETQRRLQEREREVKDRIEKRQQAIDRAMLAAMSGQFADADAALAEAEFLEADAAQVRFVSGVIHHYQGGRTAEALRDLEQACRLKPDWVAPRAFAAVVCNLTDDYEEYERHLRLAVGMTPRTADDFLFRGYATGLLCDPAALKEIEEALRRRPSVLGQVILAEIQAAVADDTGDPDLAASAAEGLRLATGTMPNSPYIRFNSLMAHCVAVQNARLARLPTASLDDALKKAHSWAKIHRKHPAAGFPLYMYARIVNQTQAFEMESPELIKINPGSGVINPYLAGLFRDARSAEGLEFFQTLKNTDAGDLPLARALYLLDTGEEAEAERICDAFYDRNHTGWNVFTAINWYYLVKGRNHAQKVAKEVRSRPDTFAGYGIREPALRLILDYQCGDQVEDKLLEAAGKRSRIDRMAIYHALGCVAFGSGNANEAALHFRNGAKDAPMAITGLPWMEALAERCEKNPPAYLKRRMKPNDKE